MTAKKGRRNRRPQASKVARKLPVIRGMSRAEQVQARGLLVTAFTRESQPAGR